MNEQKLIQNVIEQIKEAQLKLGAEKEVIRLYFPMASMNAILGTNYTDEQEMLAALRTNIVFDTTVLGRLKFFIHEGRFEVRVPAEGAEYVAHFITVPVRHHNIQQNTIRRTLLCKTDPLLCGGCDRYVEAFASQIFFIDFQHFTIIIYHQDHCHEIPPMSMPY